MQSELYIRGIKKAENKIEYDFECSDDLLRYFNFKDKYFIEYDMPISLSTVQDGILIIPFLCNVLPIIWICNVTIYIDELDKKFYESIDQFKKGYMEMYPSIDFTGNIVVKKILENKNNALHRKNLAFFSGGVDAFQTLITHHEEKPILMTLWGSDIFFDDVNGWDNVKESIFEITKQFDLDVIFIKSSFRRFLNEANLTKLINKQIKGNWWHEFQHGIGIIGHAAPLAYIYDSETVYIASSFTEKEKGEITCASDPSIDNHVKLGGSKVLHDGYGFNRQDKIKNICDYSNSRNLNIALRVCWQSPGGKNCNHCEKCYRTILAILVEGYNPNDYGFSYDEKVNLKLKKYIKYELKLDNVQIKFWNDIKNRLVQNRRILQKRPELKWILNTNFEKINCNPIKPVYVIARRCIGKVNRIWRDINGN
jgi:hypothetical protein